MREVSLGIAFEGERLFAFGTIGGLSSRAKAEALIEAGVSLAVEGQEVFIRSGGRTAHRFCEIEGDEFGRWFDDADRESLDDYLAARISRKEFMAGLAGDSDLRPVSWVMGEYEINEQGKIMAIIGSTSGAIDKTASDRRSSSEDRRTADHLL